MASYQDLEGLAGMYISGNMNLQYTLFQKTLVV